MDISIGMKHDRIVKFRDELTEAIEKAEPRRATNPHAVTEVVVYAKTTSFDGGEVIITLNNDDMERPEVPDDEVYVEVSE